MKRTLLFIACVLASVTMQAQEEVNDYIPFVDWGKSWYVARSTPGQEAIDEVEFYIPQGIEEVNCEGKAYYKMKAFINNTTETETYLIREEDRKVYLFDTDTQKEYLMFNYSLKAGDTYETYSPEYKKMVKYEVWSVEDYTEGPEVVSYDYDEEAGRMITHRRYLRKWVVQSEIEKVLCLDPKTWIEGVGSIDGPFANLFDGSYSLDHLAYVLFDGGSSYLPFSFSEAIGGLWFGCNLPTGEECYKSEDKRHQLTYELEGNRLHVYGKVLTHGGANNYAYFIEEPTNDSSVRKLHFKIKEIEPLPDPLPDSDGLYLHTTDFYVEGFPPTLDYIIIDNQGEEHPVIKKTEQMAYRPLVEEGKHWTYDNFMPLRPAKYDHYYYYDLKGDTLIAGKNSLKMYSENRDNDSVIRYEGALYEDGKKVYCFFPGKDDAELLYDFDCEVGDTLHVYDSYGTQIVVKDINIEDNGGIPIKRYKLQAISEWENMDFSWIEGVGATKDFYAMLPLDGNYNKLKTCELNGEKLYQTIEPDLTAKGYHKMGIEGKRWNYIHYYLDEDGEHRDPYSYVVKGDTIIRRTTYKKLYYQDEKTERFVCLLFEEGRTVYKNTDLGNNSYDTPTLKSFFAFDREDFGRVFTWKAENYSGNTNWMVYGVDTIEVKGQPFRRYTCLQKYSEEGETLTTIDYGGEGVWHDIWVEGVGSASGGIKDQIPLHEPELRTPGEYTYFVSCYEDGECIFTADDFNIPSKPVIDTAYRPFIEEGKMWKVGDDSGNPVKRVEYYYFDGDTIIDGKTCKQMMCQRYVNPDHSDYDVISHLPSLSYVGAWYEEDKKVYQYDLASKQFKLMYDFSVDDNATLQIHGQPYMIGPRQTGGIKGFKGVYRDVMMPWDEEQSIYNTTWLEGVGSIEGPGYNVYYGKEYHGGAFLMSCTVDDEVIYLNDEYEDGATPVEARKRIDFTHTIKTQPHAPASPQTPLQRARGTMGARAASPAEEGQTLYGEYNNLLLDINLDPLDDAYTVCITDETGKTVYEKSINAGNIVGLNIDISTYAAGRYTVTVENSRESFTGQFETVTTGIEDITLMRAGTGACPYTEGAIYNLHGQRIRSLQKGLNIINGQKAIVK